MTPFILHNPFQLPWQTELFDALILTLFGIAVLHACGGSAAVAYVGAMAVVAVRALRSASPPQSANPFALWMVGIYAAAFAPMILGNVTHDGGVRFYAVVQALGPLGMLAFATVPHWRNSVKCAAPSAPRAEIS